MLNGKRILGITLARGGSKGVSKKNIRILNGHPLIFYTISEALKSHYIDDYMVSTDSPEIAEIADQAGAEVPFLRPKAISGDKATSASAIIHAVEHLRDNKGRQYDYVVELMATNPLKEVCDIDGCIERAVIDDRDCCVAVHRIWDQHPSRVKKMIEGKLVNFYPEIPESRRQDLTPPAFIRSGSIYVTCVDYLLSSGARYGTDNTYAYVLPDERVVNIDNIDDFRLAEVKLKSRGRK